MTRAEQRKAARKANDQLHALGTVYHLRLPIADLDAILTANGFNPTEPAIYCGVDGRSHEQVGPDTWLSFSWHKMESGRLEVTAYLSL